MRCELPRSGCLLVEDYMAAFRKLNCLEISISREGCVCVGGGGRINIVRERQLNRLRLQRLRMRRDLSR